MSLCTAIKRLAAVLDATDLDVAGIQFMLGDRNGTDDVGRVWMTAAADNDVWIR